MTIQFTTDRVDDMGKFIATLIREGVTWTTTATSDGWDVILTGGF